MLPRPEVPDPQVGIRGTWPPNGLQPGGLRGTCTFDEQSQRIRGEVYGALGGDRSYLGR